VRGRRPDLLLPGQRRHLDKGPEPPAGAGAGRRRRRQLHLPAVPVLQRRLGGQAAPHRRPGQRSARLPTRALGGAVRSAGDLVAFTDQWWAVWNEQVGPTEFAPLKLFQSKTIGAGDCIDPIVKQQITVNASLDDERPSIVLKPASAGASGAELFFARTNGEAGTSGHIWRGAAGCDADWSFRQLSFAGQIDLNPDASRSGVGNNHVTFQRDGSHIVYLNNSSGTYRGREFATPGVEPRVTTSQGVVFVAFRDFRQHPFVAIFRSGAWSGRDLTPGAGGQPVLAVTASGGRGTVLAASFSSHRLYAVADL